jgi:tetratricopeptide (TPR) repeat protein
MSEFSESYHLRAEVAEQGIELLKAAGLKGVVFQPQNGWVTIIPQTTPLDAVRAMTSHNPGTLLHYVFGEDHGWAFSLYEKNKLVIQYECTWDAKLAIDDSLVDVDILGALVNPARRSELEAVLRPGLDGARSAHHRFADLVGLQHYEWLSGVYLDGIDRAQPSIAYDDSVSDEAAEDLEEEFPTWQELWAEADALLAEGRHAEAFKQYHQTVVQMHYFRDDVRLGPGGFIFERDFLARASAFATRRGGMCPAADKAGSCALAQGILRDYAADPDAAQQSYAAALKAYRSTGNRGFEAKALHNLGLVYLSQGRYAEALAHCQGAREILRDVGDRIMEPTALHAVGAIYEAQKQYEDALEIYQEVLAVWREKNQFMGKLILLNDVGRVYEVLGQAAEGQEYYRQAIPLQREWEAREESLRKAREGLRG